ncbi:MAG: hypothetical protein PUC32_01860 [Oscillospiraceae bacterium]|nr:hypothetical protein [Oscillospiraceae bacterium]
MQKRRGIKLSLLALASAMAVSLAGCGNQAADLSTIDANAVMEQVSANMSDVRSMDVSMAVRVDMTNELAQQDNQYQLQADADLAMKEEPLQFAMTAKVSGNDMEGRESQLYLVPQEKEYVCYYGATEEDNTVHWAKQTVTQQEAEKLKEQYSLQLAEGDTQQDETNEIGKLLTQSMALQVTGREQVDQKNNLVLEGTLKIGDVLALLPSSGTEEMLGGLSGLSEEVLSLYQNMTIPLRFSVEEETKLLTKCTIDFKPAVDEILQGMMQSFQTSSDDTAVTSMPIPVTVNQAEISVIVNGINETVKEITVPQEALQNAKEEDAISGIMTNV